MINASLIKVLPELVTYLGPTTLFLLSMAVLHVGFYHCYFKVKGTCPVRFQF